MPVKAAVGQPRGFHDIGDAGRLDPTLAEEPQGRLENAAMKLALYRIIREKDGTLTSYSEFLSYSALPCPKFTILRERSFLDVVSEMEERGIEDPADCVILVVCEEVFDNKE